MLSLYWAERPPLSCSQAYCLFRYPIKFLEQFVNLIIWFLLECWFRSS